MSTAVWCETPHISRVVKILHAFLDSLTIAHFPVIAFVEDEHSGPRKGIEPLLSLEPWVSPMSKKALAVSGPPQAYSVTYEALWKQYRNVSLRMFP
jgi:hypothetical protein